MGFFDYLAVIAMLLFAGSIWQTYRVAKLKQKVAAAEKCTEIQTILLDALLQAKDLYRIVRSVVDNQTNEYIFPDEIKQVSQELGQIIQAIASRIEWLQSQNIEDPVVLDEYNFYAHQVRLKLRKFSSMIKRTEAVPDEKKD